MLYVRGNKRDYDGWEKAGNYGWSYKDVLPYFIKSEDNRNPYLAKNKEYHGTGGLLTVQEAPYQTPLGTAFIQAGVELGNLFSSFMNLVFPANNLNSDTEKTINGKPVSNRKRPGPCLSLLSSSIKLFIIPVAKERKQNKKPDVF